MKYHTVRDIAKTLRKKEETVRRWIRRGELGGYNTGKALLISDADLTAYLGKIRIKAK